MQRGQGCLGSVVSVPGLLWVPSQLALPCIPPAGATVSLHKPCPIPCCQGCPHSQQTWGWQTSSGLGPSGARFERAVTLVSSPKARRAPVFLRLQKSARLLSGHADRGGGAGTVDGLCVPLSDAVCAFCCVGTLVLLPDLGSSRSYKLHSSLHPVAGLPCPRVTGTTPDRASVAAHNWKSLCGVGLTPTGVRKGLSSTKGNHCYSPKKFHQDTY